MGFRSNIGCSLVAFAAALHPLGALAALAPTPPPGTPVLPGPQSVTGVVTQTFQYDDNPLLLAHGARPAWDSLTEPQFTYTGVTPTLRLDWNTKLDAAEYNLPHFSSTDLHNDVQAAATGLIDKFSVRTHFDYDTTRTSELSSSGVAIAGIRHYGTSVVPTYQIALTPTESLNLTGSFQRSTYSNTLLFSNSETLSATASLIHAFTEQDSAFVEGITSYFKSISGAPANTRAYGVGIGWQRRFSNRWSASLSGGSQQLRSFSSTAAVSGAGTSATNSGYFFSANLAYTGDRDQLTFTARRGLVPEGFGSEATQTTANIAVTHLFTPRLHTDLYLNYFLNSYGTTGSGNAASFFGGAKSSLTTSTDFSYNLTRALSVAMTYEYRKNEFLNSSLPAESQSVLINLVFTPHAAVLGW